MIQIERGHFFSSHIEHQNVTHISSVIFYVIISASHMLSFVHAVSASRPRVASSPKPLSRGRAASFPVAPKAVIHENITTLIGNTPTIKISDKLCPPGVEMYVKAEYFNPLSSVKDRLALAVIEDAERKGTLKPGMTVVEATSGNTGTFTIFFGGDDDDRDLF